MGHQSLEAQPQAAGPKVYECRGFSRGMDRPEHILKTLNSQELCLSLQCIENPLQPQNR